MIAIYMVYKAHHDTIKSYDIVDERLPKNFNGFSVFFISDIHRRKINKRTLKKFTDKVEFVLIGGDLTERGVPFERVRENIRRLKYFDAPIYFVWGNNDYELETDQLRKLLKEEAVIILADTSIDITKQEETITLVGFDCCKGNTLLKATKEAHGAYYILAVHIPDAFHKLSETEKAQIHTVLAGHTHGGQIRLGRFGLYERGGYTQSNQTNVVISEGYGYTGLPFRLGTDAQCHLLTFKNMPKGK